MFWKSYSLDKSFDIGGDKSNVVEKIKETPDGKNLIILSRNDLYKGLNDYYIFNFSLEENKLIASCNFYNYISTDSYIILANNNFIINYSNILQLRNYNTMNIICEINLSKINEKIVLTSFGKVDDYNFILGTDKGDLVDLEIKYNNFIVNKLIHISNAKNKYTDSHWIHSIYKIRKNIYLVKDEYGYIICERKEQK